MRSASLGGDSECTGGSQEMGLIKIKIFSFQCNNDEWHLFFSPWTENVEATVLAIHSLDMLKKTKFGNFKGFPHPPDMAEYRSPRGDIHHMFFSL